ncbi:MAG: hypothetical protein HOU01_01700 [Streptomycetaceae bacterium]|nr:hypothetical protein [Streptomycetaceae bacterium]
MIDADNVPGWPVVTIEITPDGLLVVDDDALDVPPGADPRRVGTEAAARTAATLGRPVRVKAVEEDGTIFPLIVSPDGEVTEGGPALPPPQNRRKLIRRRPSAEAEPAEPAAHAPEADATAGSGGVPLRAPEPADADFFEESAPDTRTGIAGPADPESGSRNPVAGQNEIPAGPNGAGPAEGEPDPAPRHDPAALPQPDAAQAELLRDIRAAVEAGETAQARHMAAAFTAALARSGENAGSVLAAFEVEAYVTLLDGDAAKATLLYSDAAVQRGLTTPDAWARRMAANAESCWLRITDPERAYELGSSVLRAYSVAGTPDGGPPESARRRYGDLQRTLLAG